MNLIICEEIKDGGYEHYQDERPGTCVHVFFRGV